MAHTIPFPTPIEDFLSSVASLLDSEGRQEAASLLAHAEARVEILDFDAWGPGNTKWKIILTIEPTHVATPQTTSAEALIRNAANKIISQFGKQAVDVVQIVPRVVQTEGWRENYTKRSPGHSAVARPDLVAAFKGAYQAATTTPHIAFTLKEQQKAEVPFNTAPQTSGTATPITATTAAPTSPGITASMKGSAMPDPKKVFIIHGRNTNARAQLGIFVRALGLTPINFSDLRASMGGTPSIADIIEKGMDQAQGVIALVTADEYAALRPDFRASHDQPDDIMRWQARPNVLFEAGMAFGRDRKRVVFVLFGGPKLFTDVAGIHVLRPTNEPAGDRATLRATLSQGMGCDVDVHSSDWMTSGDFVSCVAVLPGVSPRDPF